MGTDTYADFLFSTATSWGVGSQVPTFLTHSPFPSQVLSGLPAIFLWKLAALWCLASQSLQDPLKGEVSALELHFLNWGRGDETGFIT